MRPSVRTRDYWALSMLTASTARLYLTGSIARHLPRRRDERRRYCRTGVREVKAKESGRNTYQFFTPQELARHRAAVARMDAPRLEGGVRLLYQPRVIGEGAIVGVEHSYDASSAERTMPPGGHPIRRVGINCRSAAGSEPKPAPTRPVPGRTRAESRPHQHHPPPHSPGIARQRLVQPCAQSWPRPAGAELLDSS